MKATMFESMAKLNPKDILSIDNAKSIDFTSNEEWLIENINQYESESGSFLIVESLSYYIFAHTLTDDAKFFIVENYDDGSKYRKKSGEFSNTIKIKDNHTATYYKSECFGSDDASDIVVCEYTSNHPYFEYAFVVKMADAVNLYRGFEVPESSIII